MTLAISMLKSIFPLHSRMQDYHLTYSNMLLYVVLFFHLKKFLMSTNGFILVISKHDTLRPLGI